MQKQQKSYLAYLASFPRSFWYCFICAVGFLVLSGIWVALMQTSSQFFLLSANVVTALAAYISFAFSWIGVKRFYWKRTADSANFSLERRLHFWIPLVFSLALLSQGIGNSVFVLQKWYPVASSSFYTWGDLIIVTMYPAVIIGILLLPRDSLLGKMPLRFIVDSFILIITIAIFSWYFNLGPIILQSQGAVLDITYPLCDLIMISCLILLSRSVADRGLRMAIRALSLALIIFVIADSFLAYESVQDTISSWPLAAHAVGCFAVALAIQAIRLLAPKTVMAERVTDEGRISAVGQLWRLFLPYSLIPAVVALIFYIWTTKQSGPLVTGTYYGVFVLLGLIFAKQLLAIREIHRLNRGLEVTQGALHEKNEALGQANGRLEALAMTDPLTELPNHRALVNILDQELVRSQQYQRSCSLLFFDLDHFKALNDGYGHAGGDIALQEFASLLRATLPVINTVGRWGGEEFIAILPEQNATEATSIAEELRETVARHSFSIGGGMHLTCSIGVASSPEHGLQQEELLQAADSAMYAAKRLGRDQVRRIDDPEVIALMKIEATVEGREDIALQGTVHAMELLVEKRDAQAKESARRVGELLLHLAQAFGLSEAETQHLSRAGQLHDLGKIVLPDHILQEQETLTEQERTLLQQHVQVGAEVVSSIPALRTLAPIIRAHHEWWNGMGYPQQQAGEAIPFGARLLAVVDAYVRMTHTQEGDERAQAELRRGAGTQFDPVVVERFLAMLADMQSISRAA